MLQSHRRRLTPLPPVLLLVASPIACGSDSSESVGTVAAASHVALPSDTLDTFLAGNDYVQIDQLDTADPCNGVPQPCPSPADANLVQGTDASGSPSVDFPPAVTNPSPNFIDWNDLAAPPSLSDHFLFDTQLISGKDTGFPGSNACVGGANVPGKDDALWVAVANNMDYVYISGLRKESVGDAALIVMLTQNAPILLADGQDQAADTDFQGQPAISCGQSEQLLKFPIEEGDVMIRMEFRPAANEPTMLFYSAPAGTNIQRDARSAVDSSSPGFPWGAPDPDAVAAAAVNTSVTDPPPFGAGTAATVKTGPLAGNLETNLLVEGAVRTDQFPGGICGRTFHGTIMTRPSHSPQNDPKDVFFGIFNFGSLEAAAEVHPRCDQKIDYAVTSITGVNGAPLSGATCTWTFVNTSDPLQQPVTVDGCAPATTSVLPPGTYEAEVTVSHPSVPADCNAVVQAGTVHVFEPVVANASLSALCVDPPRFTYDGECSGGSGQLSPHWTFSGPPGTTITADADILDGVATVSTAGSLYTGQLRCTDQRPDLPGQCFADSQPASATPLVPPVVTIVPTSAPDVCAQDSDAVTYTATVAPGTGSGTFDYTWSIVSADTLPPCASGSTATSCAIDPSNDDMCVTATLAVHVTDTGFPDCGSADSNVEQYTKITAVTP